MCSVRTGKNLSPEWKETFTFPIHTSDLPSTQQRTMSVTADPSNAAAAANAAAVTSGATGGPVSPTSPNPFASASGRRVICVSIFDKDHFTSSNFLGQVRIPFESLEPNGETLKWYPLQNKLTGENGAAAASAPAAEQQLQQPRLPGATGGGDLGRAALLASSTSAGRSSLMPYDQLRAAERTVSLKSSFRGVGNEMLMCVSLPRRRDVACAAFYGAGWGVLTTLRLASSRLRHHRRVNSSFAMIAGGVPQAEGQLQLRICYHGHATTSQSVLDDANTELMEASTHAALLLMICTQTRSH